MPDRERKSEPGEIDPTKVEQLLEIELMQKRAAWQQAKARRSNLRAMSFLFLFVVIIAALVTFFLFFSSGTIRESPASSDGESEATPLPAAPRR